MISTGLDCAAVTACASAVSSTPGPLPGTEITVDVALCVAGAGGGGDDTTEITAGDEVTESTVALTSHVPAVGGAVYRPPVSIVPHDALHFTVLVEPTTLAEKDAEAPASSVVDVGETVIETERVFERESFNGAPEARPATDKHTHAVTIIFFFKGRSLLP
jgi:hypothetical protein